MLSPARVTSTTQVMPPREAVKVEPDNEHAPDCSDHDNDPVDWPPDAERVNDVPVVNEELLVMLRPV